MPVSSVPSVPSVKKRAAAAVLAAALALAAGCGSAAAPAKGGAKAAGAAASTGSAGSAGGAAGATSTKAASGSQHALTKVSLIFDGPPSGFYAPFYAALQNGYYRRAGLDVTLSPGKGSLSTIEQVGHDNYNFGFASAASMITADTKGITDKVVAVYLQKSPEAVVSLASKPIDTPSQLIGKRIASSAGSASSQLFTGVLVANHIKPSQLKIFSVDGTTAKVAALAQGKVDGLIGFGNYALPVGAAEGLKFHQMLFATHGLPLLSNGIIVSDAYLKAHPRTVAAFVRASTQGWVWTQTHISQAVKDMDAVLKSEKRTPVRAGVQMMRLTLPLLTSSATKGHSLGWMAPSSWSATISTMTRYLGLKNAKAPSYYYTDAYVGK